MMHLLLGSSPCATVQPGWDIGSPGRHGWCRAMIEHPVPPNLLTHIGDMTVSFAMLELVIQMFFASLIREHQSVPRLIANLLSFRNLRAATLSLYLERHGNDSDFQILEEFMKQVGEIEDERNRITHSIWGTGSRTGTVTRIKSTTRIQGRSTQFEEYDEARLRDFAQRIRLVASQLQRFQLALLEQGKLVNNPIDKMW